MILRKQDFNIYWGFGNSFNSNIRYTKAWLVKAACFSPKGWVAFTVRRKETVDNSHDIAFTIGCYLPDTDCTTQ